MSSWRIGANYRLDGEATPERRQQLVLHATDGRTGRSGRAAWPSRRWRRRGRPSSRAAAVSFERGCPTCRPGTRRGAPAWSAPSPRRRSPPDRCRPSVRSCTPLDADGEAGVVHVPEGQRQRRQLLQVVVAEHLLAVDVDRLAQLGQLGQRLQVVEHRTLGVGRTCATSPTLANSDAFQSAYAACLRAVAVAEPGAVATAGRRERHRRPSGRPASTCHWKSDRWCGTACRTRSPTISSPASRQPPGSGSGGWACRRTGPGRCRRAWPP